LVSVVRAATGPIARTRLGPSLTVLGHPPGWAKPERSDSVRIHPCWPTIEYGFAFPGRPPSFSPCPTANVRFGSQADSATDVRFTPKSGHSSAQLYCCAKCWPT
jgi:hypothetical protein